MKTMMTKEDQEEINELLANFFFKKQLSIKGVISFFAANFVTISVKSGYSQEKFQGICEMMIEEFTTIKKEEDEKQSQM